MVNYQLWANIKAIRKLKKKEKKVGKLRYKGKRSFKTLNFKSRFKTDFESKKLILSYPFQSSYIAELKAKSRA